jgi:hypothetical protein
MGRIGVLGALSLLVAACNQPGSSKSVPNDSFASAKSDSAWSADYCAGAIEYGHPIATMAADCRYRMLWFDAKAGDAVDAWVRSSDGGDAVAWLLDAQFNVIAQNDDADENTVDAHVSAVLPANADAKVTTYYLAFRDYYGDTARSFTATLTAAMGVCDGSISLMVGDVQPRPTLGPYTVGSVNLCLHLENTLPATSSGGLMQHALLQVSTDMTDGKTSPFDTTLSDANGAVLKHGVDFSLGIGHPTVYSYLAWPLPASTSVDVKLLVAGKPGQSGTTRLFFSLTPSIGD